MAGSPAVASGVFAWTRQAAQSLFTVLFPSDCRICGTPLTNVSRLPVCGSCLEGIHPVQGRLCAVCGERVLSPYAVEGSDDALVCPVCRRIQPPFAAAVAYGSYDGGLRELIHLLKYGGVRPAASVLGRMLAEAMARLEFASTEGSHAAEIVVIPVPLHKAKLRRRGFNQAQLIAQVALRSPLMVRSRFRLADHVLERQRETHSQIGLTSHQRRENMRGAFAVTRPEEIRGREVLLVDDVYTTGTTVSECARVLRRAGASRVSVATVARTLKLASHFVEMKPVGADMGDEDSQAAPLAKAVGS